MLSELLELKTIAPRLKAKTKEDALKELVDILGAAGKITDRAEALRAIREREELMTTGIGLGIALPHGKTPAASELVAAFGRSAEGIDFRSLDGKPAQIFFILLSPPDCTGPHVRALASISRLLKDKAFRDKLLKLETPEEILAAIKTEEERHDLRKPEACR